MTEAPHDDVDGVLSAIEGRAFADAADALAALAEGSRAVFEAWNGTPSGSSTDERERALRERLRRLLAVADRAMLYVDAAGYSITVGYPAGLSVTLDVDRSGAEAGRRRRLRRRAG